jgi:hypothetical protein
VDDPRGYAWIHIKLGEVARDQGDCAAAGSLLKQATAFFEEQRNTPGLAWSLTNHGLVELKHGDVEWAAQLFKAGLIRFQELGHKLGIAYCLKGVAGVLAQQPACSRRAVQLFGAAAALFAAIGAGITPTDRIESDTIWPPPVPSSMRQPVTQRGLRAKQ